MTDNASKRGRRPVILGPGEGRSYPMGRIAAVFKADAHTCAAVARSRPLPWSLSRWNENVKRLRRRSHRRLRR
jgi:hypothetical protein